MSHLVITRRAEESFKIGPDVEITVHRVKGGAVRLGVKAPESMKIVRTELEQTVPANPPADRDRGSAGAL